MRKVAAVGLKAAADWLDVKVQLAIIIMQHTSPAALLFNIRKLLSRFSCSLGLSCRLSESASLIAIE